MDTWLIRTHSLPKRKPARVGIIGYYGDEMKWMNDHVYRVLVSKVRDLIHSRWHLDLQHVDFCSIAVKCGKAHILRAQTFILIMYAKI